MDINDLRGWATVVVFITFLGICWWVFIHKNKEDFDEAGNLPFADEDDQSDGRDDRDDKGDEK